MARDCWLRIASLDKRFVIAFPMGRAADESETISVFGSEFTGLDPSGGRPIRWVVPAETGLASTGFWVERLLRWPFDPGHGIVRHTRRRHSAE